MKIDTIKSNWISEGGYRLDCGPYLLGSLQAKLTIGSLKVKKDSLSELVSSNKNGMPFSLQNCLNDIISGFRASY